MRNYFTFDGVDSRSFGVYISGQGTFKAPARSYDALEIPGRNGALLGIDSRLGNVELTYPAFIYSNFAENIAAFRAFLLSHKGYFKLKDSYHPDEFRLAYYPGPFEPDVTSANNAGSFDITFICKPQRYLESGQEVVELSPSTAQVETYTGNIAEIEPGIGDRVTGLTVPFIPIQDLHGYSSPWPSGGGKNLLVPRLPSLTQAGITMTNNGDGSFNFVGTATANTNFRIDQISAGSTSNLRSYTAPFVMSMSSTATVGTLFLGGYKDGTWTTQSCPVNSNTKMTDNIDNAFAYIRFNNGDTVNATFYPQIEYGSTATSWEPYENICPITGRTGLSVYVGPTQDVSDATTYAVDWTTEAGTVYGGTLDVVTGLLTVDRASRALDGTEAGWQMNVNANHPGRTYAYNRNASLGDILTSNSIISSYVKSAIFAGTDENSGIYVDSGYLWVRIPAMREMTAVADWTTYLSNNPLQVCYELATPLTYQLTPQDITLIQNALNYIWSNAGPVTVEVTEGLRVTNPTLFDALPFLRVYGTGILGIGSHTITITAADVYTDIDCEMMDCFKGSANKNQYVQFSGNDFPTLEPGVNGFTFSGITKVEVKPRWWSV